MKFSFTKELYYFYNCQAIVPEIMQSMKCGISQYDRAVHNDSKIWFSITVSTKLKELSIVI